MEASVIRSGIITTIIALSVHVTPAVAQQPAGATPAPPPCSDVRHRDFDFWIGTWDVRTPDGRLAGRNVLERILDGCALQERWAGASGGRGTSLNFYDAGDRSWHQVWIDGQGQPLRLRGGIRDGRMLLENAYTDSAGRAVRQRITWTPLADGRVRQLWESSTDAGATWTIVFDGTYTRIGQPSVGTPDPE